MASFFQPVIDGTRVFLNSAMGGLPEMSFTEAGRANAERNRAETAAARERLGLAGDALNVAGYFVPGFGAAKGIKALPGIAKAAPSTIRAATSAIPAAERFIASKIVPGYAARASALSRLDLPAMGTVTGAVGRTVAKHPVKTLGGVGALGVGTAATHNIRTYDARNPQRPAMTQQQAKPQQRAAAPARPASASPVAAQAEANPFGGSTFDQLIDRVAAAQGGQISLAQMGALAEMVDHTQPRGTVKPPSVRDQMLGQLMAGAEGRRKAAIAHGMSEGEAGERYLSEVERFAKIAPDFSDYLDDRSE